MKIAAIIAAAGQGRRMGHKTPKQYLLLNGKPVLWHTLKTFTGMGIFSEIILVVNKKDRDYCQKHLLDKYKFKDVRCVTGGRERQDSVYEGLKSLAACDYVTIHDGVRCLVSAEVIRKTILAARKYQAAIAAVPLKDTVKESDNREMVKKTIDRDKLWSIQTPQVFRYELIMAAYRQAGRKGFYGTDDAGLVEKAGGKVRLVMASYNNIKITTAIDLAIAESVLRKGWQ